MDGPTEAQDLQDNWSETDVLHAIERLEGTFALQGLHIPAGPQVSLYRRT